MPYFDVTILGTSSSQPAFGRFPSAQILRYDDKLFMIDCGEGSQIQLSRYRVKRNKICAIFISHLHGDHIFGLPGVLTSFIHFSRTEPLRIIGPMGLKNYVDVCLKTSEAYLSFEVVIEEYDDSSEHIIYCDDNIEVISLPLDHRIPTLGFLFKEKINKQRLIPEMRDKYDLSYEEIKLLKSGHKVIRNNGAVISTSDVCYPKDKERSYVYITDTCYTESFLSMVKGVNLMYHEATYLKDLQEEATMRKHCSTIQAASIAKLADAGKLIVGHYSSRYKFLDLFESECREIFAESYLALEGQVYEVGGMRLS